MRVTRSLDTAPELTGVELTLFSPRAGAAPSQIGREITSEGRTLSPLTAWTPDLKELPAAN